MRHQQEPGNKFFQFCWENDLPQIPQNYLYHLTGNHQQPENFVDKTLKCWRKNFLPLMRDYLKGMQDGNGLRDTVTFVYADTHKGEWGEYSDELIDGGLGRIRLYNCGAWIVANKDEHPTCHLFAVTQDGTECLLDVSFKDVTVGRVSLIELATKEIENRNQTFSRALWNILQNVVWILLNGGKLVFKICWLFFNSKKAGSQNRY